MRRARWAWITAGSTDDACDDLRAALHVGKDAHSIRIRFGLAVLAGDRLAGTVAVDE